MKHILSFLLLGMLPLSALGAAPGSWTATLGLGGAVVPGTWTPLKVIVPADAGPWALEVRSFSASGRVTGPAIYSHPTGGIFEEPVFLTDAAWTLNLRFLTGDLVQEELNLPLADRRFPGHLIGVDGLGPGARAALAEVLLPQEPVKVVPLPSFRWPVSPLSYGGLSALVLNDPGPVLSPSQVRALRAWISSGGRLVVVDPRIGSGSLRSQVGEVSGLGRVIGAPAPREQAGWKVLLALEPFGKIHRLGTDFDPPALHVPPRGSSLSSAAVAFVLVWAVGGALGLFLRKKRTLGWPLVWAVAGTAVALILWSSGSLVWDRGLSIHGREVVLPGTLGRFASLEAVSSSNRWNSFGWPEASPWALGLWKAGLQAPEAKSQIVGPDRIVLESFLNPLDRPARFRVRTENNLLRWTGLKEGTWVELEEGPAELEPDRPWIQKLAAQLPGTPWSVGFDGVTCWVRPEIQVSPP